MSDRFVAVNGSELGHCCIQASVIDTGVPRDGTIQYVMAECLSRDDADTIAELLNARDGFLS